MKGKEKMKQSNLTIILVLLSLVGNIFTARLAFGAPENEVLNATLSNLRFLGQAITEKWNSDGGAADTPVYPGGGSMPCEARYEAGTPCWSNNIAGVSHDEAYGISIMEHLGRVENLYVDCEAIQGDIRFRCRTQNRQTYCFAYYCLEKAPAGCKQVWRIEWKIDPQNLAGNLGKCVQTMPGDAIAGEDWQDMCSWVGLDPNSW